MQATHRRAAPNRYKRKPAAPKPAPRTRREQEQALHDAAQDADAILTRLAEAARRDPVVFNQFVLRDDETNGSIETASMHRRWHDLITAHSRVVIWSATETGKTNSISIGRVLYELGRNPRKRIVILSDTSTQAAKIVGAIKRYIETSEELHLVFPKLKPGVVWRHDAITVERDTIGKDFSVQAVGYGGAVNGARADLIIIDDLLGPDNTGTPAAREKVWKWLKAIIHGRLTAKAKLVIVGTAWHPDDVMHRYSRQVNFVFERFPIIDERGNLAWESRWSRERVEESRIDLGPIEYARQKLCIARNDNIAVFKSETVEVALRMGDGRSTCHTLHTIPNGYRTFTGVDLAVSEASDADETALFSMAIDTRGVRHPLCIEAGRWRGAAIVDRIYDHYARYGGIVVVENNAAQDFIRQWALERGALPIIGYTTGRQKADPTFGVESLAVEMAAGKWAIPNRGGRLYGASNDDVDAKCFIDPELKKWIDEMLFYSKGRHTGDRLMASWLAREGERLGNAATESGHLDTIRR